MVVAKLIVLSLLFGFLLLLGGLLWWRYCSQKKWLVSFASCVLIVFALVAADTIKEYEELVNRYSEEIQRLRALYPVESIEPRLPPPVLSRGDVKLSEASRNNLLELESSNEFTDRNEREELLKRLHAGSVDEFVRREGFGVARMLSGYAESVLGNFGRGKTPIPQPGGDLSDSWKQIDLNKVPDYVNSFSFLCAHSSNVLHFVNPTGFGFMKDPKRFVGFQGHQFNKLPEPVPWKLKRLELLGLLLAEEPRVYVTAMLPRMEEIRAAPTRALDVFEAAGLAKLHGGEELYIREAPEGVRMLGAVRSVKQCINCHGGERGDLLGAFSYFLENMP
jgi:hypothetical protein